jgi:hypothetical protein
MHYLSKPSGQREKSMTVGTANSYSGQRALLILRRLTHSYSFNKFNAFLASLSNACTASVRSSTLVSSALLWLSPRSD